MSSAEYAQADTAVHQAPLAEMEQQCAGGTGPEQSRAASAQSTHQPASPLAGADALWLFPPNPDGQQRRSNGRSGPGRSGAKLARQVCQELGWFTTQGRLKEMSCNR